jgi:hypothetical protein
VAGKGAKVRSECCQGCQHFASGIVAIWAGGGGSGVPRMILADGPLPAADVQRQADPT